MGNYDHIRCEYPLPVGQDAVYQTKDTPQQMLYDYTIKSDGTLWVEEFDVEDRSDPNAEGIARMFGLVTRVNKRLVKSDYTGEMCFYTAWPRYTVKWIEYKGNFESGQLIDLTLTEYEAAPTAQQAAVKLREQLVQYDSVMSVQAVTGARIEVELSRPDERVYRVLIPPAVTIEQMVEAEGKPPLSFDRIGVDLVGVSEPDLSNMSLMVSMDARVLIGREAGVIAGVMIPKDKVVEE